MPTSIRCRMQSTSGQHQKTSHLRRSGAWRPQEDRPECMETRCMAGAEQPLWAEYRALSLQEVKSGWGREWDVFWVLLPGNYIWVPPGMPSSFVTLNIYPVFQVSQVLQWAKYSWDELSANGLISPSKRNNANLKPGLLALWKQNMVRWSWLMRVGRLSPSKETDWGLGLGSLSEHEWVVSKQPDSPFCQSIHMFICTCHLSPY
jgi:hypothetical protein